MREWLVIENSWKNAIFASYGAKRPTGYIPRDVVEGELGIVVKDDGVSWFTREEGDRMRAHPEWTTTEPQWSPLGFWLP